MELSNLFYFIAALSVTTALMVVLSRNAVYSAVLLVITFFLLAVQYLLLEAYFLAVLEVLVYAGAIMVLFVFVIMLLNVGKEEKLPKLIQFQKALSVFLVVLFFIGVSLLVMNGSNELHVTSVQSSMGNVSALGTALFSKYLFPFEIASLLLLVALIGTVFLAQRKV